jgi:hypothetical protein
MATLALTAKPFALLCLGEFMRLERWCLGSAAVTLAFALKTNAAETQIEGRGMMRIRSVLTRS